MGLKDFMDKDLISKDLVDKARGVANTATDMGGKLVDEFNEALPTMRALGFTLSDLHVGMGLMPEIGAKLIASADKIDVKKVTELAEKNPQNKTLVAALKGLEAAYNIKQSISDFPFKGVQIDITLGLPPHIGVGFLNSAPVAIATAAG